MFEFSIGVADNRPGIREKYFNKIFHPFQMLSPCERAESNGIGRAIVRKVAEMDAAWPGWNLRSASEAPSFLRLPSKSVLKRLNVRLISTP